jgi:three-Cys-motif partner protein
MTRSYGRKLIYSEPDEFLTPRVGSWASKKYSLLALYDELFATGMKNRKRRVYVDLFAGAGKAVIEGTERVVLGSPHIALGIPDKFDRYIFFEREDLLRSALRARVERAHPAADVHYLGDCDVDCEAVFNLVPTRSRDPDVLTFCFVDPFSLRLKFETLRTAQQAPSGFPRTIGFGVRCTAQRSDLFGERQPAG